MSTQQFLVAVHAADGWFLDAVIAEDFEEARNIASRGRASVVQAIAFPLSGVLTAIAELQPLDRALEVRPA